MRARQYSWITGAFLLACLVGCGVDGGRGSTGFDISEDAAISRVLDTQECLGLGQLTICPADQKHTLTPTATAVTPTPTPGSGPTPTPIPGPAQRIDTGVAAGASIACIRPRPDAACELTFGFSVTGFPAGTTFRVASRLSPESNWHLAAAPTSGAIADPPRYQSMIAVQLPPETSEAQIQFAVLAFLDPPGAMPDEFQVLGESGADSAFVTDEFLLEVITIEPQPTPTLESTPVSTPTVEPTSGPSTATPTTGLPAIGPIITYAGMARADDLALAPTDFDGEGRPIYVRQVGSGLSLIIEGRPGPDGSRVGTSAYDGSGGFGDLHVLVSRPLGNGSIAVCDVTASEVGGVPATTPLAFSGDAAVIAASNDLSCRVDDGAGQPRGRGPSEACTRDRSSEFRFVDPGSTVQFCLPIAGAWSFAPGDTTVAVRLRGEGGEVGVPREIIVRVAAPSDVTPAPQPTATQAAELSPTPPPMPSEPPPSIPSPPSPTATATPLVVEGPLLTHLGIARADNLPLIPIGYDAAQRPIFSVRFGHGISLIAEGQPGPNRLPPGDTAYDDSGALGDLHIIVSRALGDGSATVCDKSMPLIGGIPATNPFEFSNDPAVVAAINDLTCRVDDGTGQPRGRPASIACTRDRSGEYRFVNPSSTLQFCLPIVAAWPFPLGDTTVAARLRNTRGGLSASHEIVVRVTALGTSP